MPTGGAGPQPGSPLSMKVSARTQTPLTATTRSATDREAQACRSRLVHFRAAPHPMGQVTAQCFYHMSSINCWFRLATATNV